MRNDIKCSGFLVVVRKEARSGKKQRKGGGAVVGALHRNALACLVGIELGLCAAFGIIRAHRDMDMMSLFLPYFASFPLGCLVMIVVGGGLVGWLVGCGSVSEGRVAKDS